MTFYKIKQKGRNFLNDAHWVTESYNKYGEIWLNLRGGWCMKSEMLNMLIAKIKSTEVSE